MTDQELLVADIIPALPDWNRNYEPLPEELIGARVLSVGTYSDPNAARSGLSLVVDFVPNGSTLAKRVVFVFNELGMWVAANGALPHG